MSLSFLFFSLLAESTSTSLSDSGIVGALIGAAGGGGFAIWYGWYTTTKTLPEQAKVFSTTIENLCKNHQEDLRTLWAEKRDESKEMRLSIFNLTTELATFRQNLPGICKHNT